MSEQRPRPGHEGAPEDVPDDVPDDAGAPPAAGAGPPASMGGGSAQRRADELAAASDPAAAAWAAGAEGERRVAEELSRLGAAYTVLHDRLLRPGLSEANLDHVVVGRAGLFLVDAKNRAGRVAAWEDGLFQHVIRDGRPQSVSLAGELRKVHGMAAHMAAGTGSRVTPVLCLAGAQEAAFGDPRNLRGVWVVPLSRLVAWLESRPPVLDPDGAARLATRAMTEFPATTTDPDLLAAIGRAAARAQPASGRTARTCGPVPSTGRSRRRAARSQTPHRGLSAWVVKWGLLLVALSAAPFVLPPVLSAMSPVVAGRVADMVGPGPAADLVPDPDPGPDPTSSAARPSAHLAATDCARVSQAEVRRIVGRSVHPVAISSGCAWGTRLDDLATVLVSIRMSAGHPAYDLQLATSVKQHRVVYGTALMPTYAVGTGLWVATGQPIGRGPSRVLARADTTVVVAADRLKVSDDRGRALALALAQEANRAP